MKTAQVAQAPEWWQVRWPVALAALTVAALIWFVILDAAAPAAVRKVREAKTGQARMELQSLEYEVDIFFLEHRRYPSSLAELEKWGLGQHRTIQLKDPWDKPFTYLPPAAKSSRPTLICLGSDGEPGGTGSAADFDIDKVHDASGR